MMTTLQSLINALRDELQHYGEMLALLDQQQDAENLRGAGDLLGSISTVAAHGETLQLARRHRADLQRRLAESLNQPPHSPLDRMMPLLPEQYRPLLSALNNENGELISRVRQRAEENQVLLRRGIDLLQGVVLNLGPDTESAAPTLIDNADEPPLYQAIA